VLIPILLIIGSLVLDRLPSRSQALHRSGCVIWNDFCVDIFRDTRTGLLLPLFESSVATTMMMEPVSSR
jgi:hypothetical protein